MSNPPLPKRSDGLLTVDLGVDRKTQWAAWCRQRDLLPTKALRQLVDKALAEGLELSAGPRGDVRVVLVDVPDVGEKVPRELRFTPSEDAAIQAASAAQDLGYQEWVIAAVRAALVKAPTFGQAELEALTASNAMLAKVVMDLAALRRAQADSSIAGKLAQLESEVRKHVDVASALMAQGVHRWQLKL